MSEYSPIKQVVVGHPTYDPSSHPSALRGFTIRVDNSESPKPYYMEQVGGKVPTALRQRSMWRRGPWGQIGKGFLHGQCVVPLQMKQEVQGDHTLTKPFVLSPLKGNFVN
jgi:hypothetical protein